jgi:hypothetical protein
MLVTQSADWEITLSHDVRPSTSTGATVTPGNNTFGSWASVMAATSQPTHGIEVFVCGIGSAAKASDSLTNIGIDPAGGSSYTTLIPNLLSSYSFTFGATGVGYGCSWYFPVYIPAGATIGAQGSINNATVGTQQVFVKLYRSLVPGIVRCGAGVTSYGADTAASCGTAVTFGTASIGAWTQLGSAVAAPAPWHWVVSSALKNSAAITGGTYVADLGIGDASNKRVVVPRSEHAVNVAEQRTAIHRGWDGRSTVGDIVYCRGWSATAETAFSAIAYGVYGDAG